MTAAFYATVADFLVAAHFCYVAFTVGGELVIIVGAILRWEWVRNLPFRIVHLCAAVLVAVEASTEVPCPLTEWEYRLRELSGRLAEEHISFIARIVRSIIFYDFPAWVFLVAYISFALLVGLTFVLVRPRRRRSPKGAPRGAEQRSLRRVLPSDPAVPDRTPAGRFPAGCGRTPRHRPGPRG